LIFDLKAAIGNSGRIVSVSSEFAEWATDSGKLDSGSLDSPKVSRVTEMMEANPDRSVEKLESRAPIGLVTVLSRSSGERRRGAFSSVLRDRSIG